MDNKVSVILPSHNEEKIIKKAIESILNQRYSNNIDIYVILDNCTDRTEEILNKNFSENYQVKIFKTVKNKYKKAGALNQLFNIAFKDLSEYILVMDADTVLHHESIENGVKFLNNNKENAAVCSIAGVMIPEKKNLLWYLQNLEYGFGDTSFIENQGNVFVCRGMYSMYRKTALEKVLNRGYIYDQESITEDYELTLELKRNGYKISNSKDIKAYTDVPLTFKDFWIQRVRWMKGGVKDLIKHGFKAHTKKDIFEAIFYRILIFIQWFFLIEVVRAKNINLFWTVAILAIYVLNISIRFKYVRNKDFKMYVVCFSLIPLIIYGMLDAVLTIYTTFLALLNVKTSWR